MKTEEAIKVLETIHLPGNCKCGDPVCNSTWDFRLTHVQRDVLQQLIDKVISENKPKPQ